MGEVADMMLDGTLCATCGVFLGVCEGYPVYCASCRTDDDEPPPKRRKRNQRERKRLKRQQQKRRRQRRAAKAGGEGK